MIRLHKSSSLLKEPTGIRIPALAKLFVAKETPVQTQTQKEDPDRYRQEHGKCPKGYHVDEETGKCLTNEQLIEKLKGRMESESKEKAQGEKEQKQKQYQQGVPSIRREDDSGDDFDDVLDQVKSSYGVMKHVPKSLRSAVKYPFKFLADRYKKGTSKWSGAIKEEEDAIHKAHADNPFLNGEQLSPEEETKAAKSLFSGAGARWGRAIAKVGGKAFSWAKSPKEAVKDVGRTFGKTLAFVGRRVGDVAEIMGGLVGKHKAVGSTLSKIIAGRFDEVTKKEKQACWEVGLEAAEIVVIGHLVHGKHAAHAAVAQHVSETAGSVTEESMTSALTDHIKEASHEAITEESKLAAASEFAKGAFHEYVKKMETGGTIRLIDDIAHGVVHGDHTQQAKHAGFKIASDNDNLKAAHAYFAKRILEDFIEKTKGYKPTPEVAFRAMQTVGDLAKITRLAKMETQEPEKVESVPEVSEGILQKMEKVSSRSTPSEKNWYDFGLMKTISSSFRKSIKKVVGNLYEFTWMNSPPHHEKKHLRNFGDVVIELKDGFHKDPKWSDMKPKVMSVVHSFEKDYPGITFSITKVGSGRNLIMSHSQHYHYPKEEGTHFVYRVDDLVRWW